jgi:FixJ family two-component response regulator
MIPARSLVSVVDDDESVRESLPSLLGQFGFASRAFSSAREFLASDHSEHTACLVLDIAMPGMSGLDLQRELKRRCQEIPIVFITARRDETTRTRLLALGAVECLHKPFSDTDLGEAVTRAVRTSETVPHPPAAPGAATVYVVDDDLSVRESLELLLLADGYRPQVFASANEFLARPPMRAPSCLVLDVGLPDLNGLELQQRLSDHRLEMPIIFITGRGDIPMTVQAMKAGAVEFLTKPLPNQALLEAIGSAVARSRAALADGAELQTLRERYGSLSLREQQVMALVVAGLLNKQVGGELGISEITVKAHRGKVMRKMKADSLADLVKMAATLGLERTPPQA